MNCYTMIPDIICFVEVNNAYLDEIDFSKLSYINKLDTVDNYVNELINSEYPYEAFFVYDNISNENKTLKVVNLKDEETFRCVFQAFESVAANFFVNMDFYEFYSARDSNGIFRSFCDH
ncbi:unnamed protein product [Cunninghamella echinulata]